MSDKIEYLKKTIAAMDKKGSNSILMDKQFLKELISEIELLQKSLDSQQQQQNKKNVQILSGGSFKSDK